MNIIIENLLTKLNVPSLNDYTEGMKIIDFSLTIQDTSVLVEQVLQDIILNFPCVDKVKISIINEAGDTVVISNQNSPICINNLDYFEDGNATLKCHIEKEITSDNHLNIYDYEKFCLSVKERKILEVISMFSNLLIEHDYVIFDILDSNVLFSTKTFEFKGSTIVGNLINEYRYERLAIVRENSNFRNMSAYAVLPEDFSFEHKNNNNLLQDVFEKIECLLSMAYIANDAELSDEILKIRISGQRNIDMHCSINTIGYNKEVIKIYNWIYNGGNCTDKAVIARNILSLHCRYADLLHIDEKTYASIQSNYMLYQRENVDKYLDLKNLVAGNINETIEKASELALSIPNGIKNNILAVFTFLFTVILANIVSAAPLTNIFTRDITAIFEIILGASFVFLAYTLYETNYKIKKIQLGYTKLKENYEDVFDVAELQEIFKEDSFENTTIKEIKIQRNIAIAVWIILIVIGIIVVESISSSPTIELICKAIS